jgi:hypothetical protein
VDGGLLSIGGIVRREMTPYATASLFSQTQRRQGETRVSAQERGFGEIDHPRIRSKNVGFVHG